MQNAISLLRSTLITVQTDQNTQLDYETNILIEKALKMTDGFEKTVPVMPKKAIVLHESKTGWNAEFLVDGKPDQDMVRIFDTHILPTAFTPMAALNEVMLEVQKANPDCLVCFSIKVQKD